MPVYEYRCSGCGAIIEVLKRMTEEGLKECPLCGNKVKQVYSPPVIIWNCGV